MELNSNSLKKYISKFSNGKNFPKNFEMGEIQKDNHSSFCKIFFSSWNTQKGPITQLLFKFIFYLFDLNVHEYLFWYT